MRRHLFVNLSCLVGVLSLVVANAGAGQPTDVFTLDNGELHTDNYVHTEAVIVVSGVQQISEPPIAIGVGRGPASADPNLLDRPDGAMAIAEPNLTTVNTLNITNGAGMNFATLQIPLDAIDKGARAPTSSDPADAKQ